MEKENRKRLRENEKNGKLTRSKKGKKKEEDEEIEDEETEDENNLVEEVEEETEAETDEEREETEAETEEVDESLLAFENCWKQLGPPTNEEEIIGKWFACIYLKQKQPYLYIGRALRRFLLDAEDENGAAVAALEINCLEHKLGVTDTHLKQGKDDIDCFPVKNILCGPLEMKPLKGSKWDCTQYLEVRKIFERAKKMDREALYNRFVSSL